MYTLCDLLRLASFTQHVPLRFNHAIYQSLFFLILLNRISLYRCTTVIPLPVEYLNCFPFSLILNKAAMNIAYRFWHEHKFIYF